jgi:hypothetical protein
MPVDLVPGVGGCRGVCLGLLLGTEGRGPRVDSSGPRLGAGRSKGWSESMSRRSSAPCPAAGVRMRHTPSRHSPTPARTRLSDKSQGWTIKKFVRTARRYRTVSRPKPNCLATACDSAVIGGSPDDARAPSALPEPSTPG